MGNDGISFLPLQWDKGRNREASKIMGDRKGIIAFDMGTGKKVGAVVVTYNYDYEALEALLSDICGKIEEVFLIDNNPDPDQGAHAHILLLFKNCSIIANNANVGLAKALNQGIRSALSTKCDYILLLDQDSRPAGDMLKHLFAARDRLMENENKVAALGPCVLDLYRRATLPFLRFEGKRTRKTPPESVGNDHIAVDFLISSGSLLVSRVLSENYLMDETLFIDNIDLEWCFRIKNAGYRIFGVPRAVLFHSLGDGIVFIPFVKSPILLHSPQRQYFMMRNRLLLYRRTYVPIIWKLHDISRLIFKLLFFSFYVSPRRENVLMMLMGIRDGILQRTPTMLQNMQIGKM
jgi:rhamnosyltransferase